MSHKGQTIHKVENGYVISDNHCWMPGCYEDERTAHYAFEFCDDVLSRLRDDAARRKTYVITFAELDAEPEKMCAGCRRANGLT